METELFSSEKWQQLQEAGAGWVGDIVFCLPPLQVIGEGESPTLGFWGWLIA